MMRDYRETLLEAVRALMAEGDLNMRLTYAAGHLLQLDDDDVPRGALKAFDRVRDPLIAKSMVVKGVMVPRDLGAAEANAAALGVLSLLTVELDGL